MDKLFPFNIIVPMQRPDGPEAGSPGKGPWYRPDGPEADGPGPGLAGHAAGPDDDGRAAHRDAAGGVSGEGPEGAGAAEAYIALGSNLGDRGGMLAEALRRLDAGEGVTVTGVSAVYETDPVGYTEQPAFLNMAAALRTTLPPVALLRLLLEVERQLGRVRDVRWGPRVIDLDLLLYGAVKMDGAELTLPHPRMMERAFVLVPLADVLPAGHPLRRDVAGLAASALREGKEGIVLWNTINWRRGSAPSAN